MLPFLRHLLNFAARFAILIFALLALAFGMEANGSGLEAALSTEFFYRVRQAILSSLLVIVPAIFLFAIQQTIKERRGTR